MLEYHPSISMLETVAEGIRKIPEIEAVFVGGATTCLYIDDESLGQVRSTKDVDCTIEVVSYSEYSYLEKLLRKNEFKNVTNDGAPLYKNKRQPEKMEYKKLLDKTVIPTEKGIKDYIGTKVELWEWYSQVCF